MTLAQDFHSSGATPATLQLMQAVRQDDMAAAAEALAGGAAIDARDEDGNTPLQLAVRQSSHLMAGMLLGYEPDVNATNRAGETALQMAAVHKLEKTTDLLLRFDADPLLLQGAPARNFVTLRAALGGNRRVVEALLGAGASATATSGFDDTPLIVTAAGAGRDEIVEVLLQHGAGPNDCDSKKYSPLRAAIDAKSAACVRLLLAANADPGIKCERAPTFSSRTTDYTAALSSTPEISAAVTEAYQKFLVNKYAGDGDLIRVTELLDNGIPADTVDHKGHTALAYACGAGYPDIVAALLAHGADHAFKNPQGAVPLQLCIENGDARSAQHLLEKGAVIPAGGLALACRKLNPALVRLLLDHGAKVEEEGGGSWPLHIAVSQSQADIVKLLLAKDADAARTCEDGSTLLHIAVKNNDLACAEMLVEKGVSTFAQDKNGDTPLHVMGNKCPEELRELLTERRAEESEAMAKGATRLGQTTKTIKALKFVKPGQG